MWFKFIQRHWHLGLSHLDDFGLHLHGGYFNSWLRCINNSGRIFGIDHLIRGYYGWSHNIWVLSVIDNGGSVLGLDDLFFRDHFLNNLFDDWLRIYDGAVSSFEDLLSLLNFLVLNDTFAFFESFVDVVRSEGIRTSREGLVGSIELADNLVSLLYFQFVLVLRYFGSGLFQVFFEVLQVFDLVFLIDDLGVVQDGVNFLSLVCDLGHIWLYHRDIFLWGKFFDDFFHDNLLLFAGLVLGI